jgi:hypothetical protein
MGAAKREKEKKVNVVLSEEFDQDLFDFEMEEDPELYESAGIPLPAMSTPDNSVNIQKSHLFYPCFARIKCHSESLCDAP